MQRRRERDTFAPDELAVVLSRYDLGDIESITEFRRGSRRSPKVGVVSERGKFLLKKRDRLRGGGEHVRFIHAVQLHLASKGFPLPRLIPTRRGGETALDFNGALYELFDYVSGHPFCGEGEETVDAGRTLAVFHMAMSDFPFDAGVRRTGYHDAVAVRTGLESIPGQVASHESAAGQDAEILGLTTMLYEAYTVAAENVDRLGFDDWPDGITHSDWHPGNLLFKRGKVLAVVDYDCAKVGKTAADVANGALQFSMIGGTDPSEWPDHLDLGRVQEFVGGYTSARPLPPDQQQVLPHLMMEALIAEAVLPIAATGSFGPFPGFGFLRMVRRKVAWMQSHLRELQAFQPGRPTPS